MTEFGRILWVILLSFILFSFSFPQSQDKKFLAIIPTFHDREEYSENPIQLVHQEFVLFLYQDAAAVYLRADFVNTSVESVTSGFSLPSTGHDENGNEPGGRISNGILDVILWVEGEKISPELIHEGEEDLYTIDMKFGPSETRNVNALFWAQTSLTDYDATPGLDTAIIPGGKRGLMVDIAHASAWNDIVESIGITAVLKEGLSAEDKSFSAVPETYAAEDSVLSWKFENIEPSYENNIFIWYSAPDRRRQEFGSMEKLSKHIVHIAYDELLEYIRQFQEED